MGESSLLKIISEKLVKPSSPTPPCSRYYKFSAFDVYVGHRLTTVALCYPEGSFHGGNYSLPRTEPLFELLETSLSKTLTYYYPFAGRFMDDNVTVDCNDAGVQLWQVQIQGSMSEILNNHADYIHPWNSVFLHEMYRCVISHVRIQLSYFECGGICVAISLSHKLGDGATLANFVNDWAAVARGSRNVRVPAPVLSAASLFPPPNYPIKTTMYERASNLVTRRFVFSASTISELKRKVTAETEIKNPTQIEVVTALIFKSIMSAANKLTASGSFKPSSLMQIVNFRPITIPPLSEQMVGNFVNRFVITVTEEKEMLFSGIVTELRKLKVKYMDTHRACIEGNEFMNRLIKFWIEDEKKLKDNNFDMYTFSSWLRFPFYEADFGFGKPMFVCKPGGVEEQTTVLMSNQSGDGIEALVTLKTDQMSIFEHDHELLALASVNPIIFAQRI